MTRRRIRDDSDTRGISTLRAIAHQQIDELCNELAWKHDLAYGPVQGERAGPVSTSVAADPTGTEAASRRGLRHQVRRGMRDLRWLVDRKLPELAGKLETRDDEPRLSDDERGASLEGGVSAYRGDRYAPAGRGDLQESLDAQRRRLHRGAGYGRG